MNDQLADQISTLPAGGHLCLVYDSDPAEQIPALVPFIRHGLASNEQFVYIADDFSVDELEAHLERHGIRVPEACEQGQLKLWTRARWRLPGPLDSQAKAQQVRQLIAEAALAGFKGIRFAIEMTWTLGPDIDSEKLEHWEATLNTIFEPAFPTRMICQYNRKRLPPDTLIAALHTHPDVILGDQVYTNSFFAAPLILRGNGYSQDTRSVRHHNGHSQPDSSHPNHDQFKNLQDRVAWMLSQLERARSAEQDRHNLHLERAARAQAEEASRRTLASEQRLRAVVENTPDCIKLLRPNGTVAEMNNAGLCMLEAESASQVIGRSIFEVIAPEHQEPFRAMHQSVCHGTPARLEFQILSLKGTRRWMETHAAPIPNPEGPGFLNLAISRDTTSRKATEQALRQSEALFRQLADSMPHIVWAARPDGSIDYYNQRWYEFTGLGQTQDQASWRAFLHPDDLERSLEAYSAALINEQPYNVEIRLKDRHHGSFRWFLGRALPIRDESARVIRWFGTFTDIDDQKRAAEHLERAVQDRTASLREAIAQMEEFSYTVSHDLRAPARAMKGYAKIILEDFGRDLQPQVKEFLECIIRGGSRMDKLIQDVLTYSRLSRRELALAPVSLDKLVPDIIQQYPDMQSPRATILLRSPLLPVLAHEASLSQAISNLLANAVKFVRPGDSPHVILWTEPRGETVRLWVEDQGIGIKPKHHHRIFGIFERLHTSDYYEGTGIGLAIVRKAVEKMGGSVGVESDGLSGSRFWVQLAPAPASLRAG